MNYGLISRLRRHGLTVRQGGTHLRVLKEGNYFFTLPCTPSDHRSLINAEKDIMRKLKEETGQ